MVLALLILFLPVAIEVYADRHGDVHKTRDVFFRLLFFIGCSLLVWLIWKVNFFKALFLSFALFVFFFDYLVTIVLNYTFYEKKVNWFTYVRKEGFDRFWYMWPAWLRFGLRLIILIAALLIYFI
jgi:hypothetical protein